MIQFECPKCLQQVNARDQQAGQRTDCPGCSVSLLVPSPAAGLFDDLFDSDEQIVAPDDEVADEESAEESLPATPVVSKQKQQKQSPRDKSIDKKAKEKVQEPAAKVESLVESIADSGSSSDFFEDLQFPETPDQSLDEGHDDLLDQLEGEDPFEINEDKRLEIDGVTDVSSLPESFAVKCNVCDSHMFVVAQSVGTEIECADCFSKITVPPPTEKQIEVAKKQKSKILEAIELQAGGKKSQDDEILDVEVDPSFGLAPVDQDLLSPVRAPTGEDGSDEGFDNDLKLEAPTDLFVDAEGEVEKEASQKTKGRKSRSSKAKTNSATAEKLDPYRSRSAQAAKQNKLRQKKKASPQSPAGLEFPKFEFDSLFSEMVNLVSQTHVALRCVLVGLLLAAGNVIGHFAVAGYAEIKDPTMGDKAFMWFWRLGAGWTLFGLGSLFLWYFAGVVFRKTANGDRRIESWKIGPSTEWTSTFLLIGFSFAVAGSPMLMFGATWLSAPLRFFLALPMLVSVWFTQSPFHIISTDAFARYRRQRPQWRSVWLVVFALASFAFVSGLLMAIPIPYFNVITSTLGAIALSFATLGYAAVAGWHSGKVVEDLK